MADEKVLKAEIERSISMLCKRLNGRYINFFDSKTVPFGSRRPIGHELYIIPTGSYAFGEWRRGDDVRLVMMVPGSRIILWSLIAETFSLRDGSLSFQPWVELSSGALSMTQTWDASDLAVFSSLRRKDKADCKFYLHYCRIPASYDPLSSPTFPDHTTDIDQDDNLKLVLDSQTLATTIPAYTPSQPPGDATPAPGLPIVRFRKVYRRLHNWAVESGILSAKFGFLDAECLTWLVHHNHVQRKFESGNFDESNEVFIATLKYLGSLIVQCMETATLDGISLLIETPSKRHVSAHVTMEAAIAIHGAIMVSSKSSLVAALNPRSLRLLATRELPCGLTIHCSCLGATRSQQAEFEAEIVPRNINAVMKKLRTSISEGLFARLWPYPSQEPQGYASCCYTVGIAYGDPARNTSTKQLEATVDDIAADVNANVIDAPTATFFITVVPFKRGKSPSSLRINNAEEITPMSTAKATPDPPPDPTPEPTPVRDQRFRSVSEVVGRLRHDPAHAAIEYDLGYKDRFEEGLVWMGLESWGNKPVESDDFVPEHRVKMLRRRADGVVVWDRTRRIDRSGL